MKKWIKNVLYVSMIVMLFAILVVMFVHSKDSHSSLPTDTTQQDLPTTQIQYNEYRLSMDICESVFGMNPETFVNARGKDTLLENGYTNAWVTSDQVLILQLTDAQLDSWRNSNVSLQILQKISSACFTPKTRKTYRKFRIISVKQTDDLDFKLERILRTAMDY